MVIETPRAEIEARAQGHEPRAAAAGRRPAAAPGRACRGTSARRVQRAGRGRATRPTTWRRSPATRTSRSTSPRRSAATCGRGAATEETTERLAGIDSTPERRGSRRVASGRAPAARGAALSLRRGEPRAVTEIAIHRREPTPRMGFFTDTTTCIGCKACEVACKQWNDLPADGHSGGTSYDYTGRLSASTWRHVRFVEVAAGDGRAATGLLHVRRVQALHERGLPRRVPDRGAHPHRVRDRDRAAGRLQRLRLLRAGVPVRRDRPRPLRRPAPRSARSATTGSRTGSSRRARRRARRTRSSSAPLGGADRAAPRRGCSSCTSAGSRARTSTAPATLRARSSPAASARSSS